MTDNSVPWYIPSKPDWNRLDLHELEALRKKWLDECRQALHDAMFVTRTLGRRLAPPPNRNRNLTFVFEIGADDADTWTYIYYCSPDDNYNLTLKKSDAHETIRVVKNGGIDDRYLLYGELYADYTQKNGEYDYRPDQSFCVPDIWIPLINETMDRAKKAADAEKSALELPERIRLAEMLHLIGKEA